MHSPAMIFLLHLTAAWMVIVLFARAMGFLATRIGQPAVVGEMVAGILLGPSLLGWAWPAATTYLFAETKTTLYAIGMIGLSFYMFLVGVEHMSETHGTSSSTRLPILLGVGGVLLPLAAGAAASWNLRDTFKPDGVSDTVFLLFMGGSLAVTAFPMLARFLQERAMVHTRLGSVATRAAAIDDALAWCLLALISALVAGNGLQGVMQTLIPAALFVAAAALIVPRLFGRSVRHAVAQGHIPDGMLSVIFGIVLGAGWLTDRIGIYSVFGGFIIGVTMPRVPGFYRILQSSLLPTIRCLFLPVFFAFSGLNTNLRDIQARYLIATGIMFAAAFFSKAAVGTLVARAHGWTWSDSIALGGLMNARGLMILLFINIGLSLGIVRVDMFSVLVVIAVLTTALATPIYRACISINDEDRARAEYRATPAPPPSAESSISGAVPIPSIASTSVQQPAPDPAAR